jgi:hypothetical protein
MEIRMVHEFVRRLAVVGLVGVIVGGLWVLAHWKAELESPMPRLFSSPLLPPIIDSNAFPGLASDAAPTDDVSFDQVLFENDQVVRMG